MGAFGDFWLNCIGEFFSKYFFSNSLEKCRYLPLTHAKMWLESFPFNLWAPIMKQFISWLKTTFGESSCILYELTLQESTADLLGMKGKGSCSEFWWDILERALTSTIYKGPIKRKIRKKKHLIIYVRWLRNHDLILILIAVLWSSIAPFYSKAEIEVEI